MAVFTSFLHGVIHAGRLRLREPLPAAPEPEATALLAESYRLHALGVVQRQGSPEPGSRAPGRFSWAYLCAHSE